MTQRPFHDEPRRDIVRRRVLTIGRSLSLLLVVTLLLPLLLALGVAVDLVRSLTRKRPWMSVRLILFGWSFLAIEALGLAWLCWVWVLAGAGRRRERLIALTWPVQRWWARTLFAVVRRLFRLDLQVEGHELATPGPILAFFRHASIVDNLLPALLITDAKQMRIRWVIKRELLSVPSLDVAGTRLPNYFVDRNADDPRSEIRAIRRLGTDLEPDEGVLIYPEGTRFTQSRRQRALDDLVKRTPALYERARHLRHVLPPRLGGPLALLDTGNDVLVCAHEGLGGFARIRDVWSGALVGRTVRVKFWRTAAADIPSSRQARIDWLYEQWERIDAWVAAMKAEQEGATHPAA